MVLCFSAKYVVSYTTKVEIVNVDCSNHPFDLIDTNDSEVFTPLKKPGD